jgi:predicted Zn finger-like uncharacterized protein
VEPGKPPRFWSIFADKEDKIMEIQCEHCDAKYNVPDERLKGDGPFRFSCPKCKNAIRLESVPHGGKDVPPGPEPPPGPVEKEGAGGGPGFSSFRNLQGKKTALILEQDPEEAKSIMAVVDKLGYEAVHAAGARDAIGQMRFHRFDLIVITDNFEDVAWRENAILNYVNTLSMSVRRRMFVVLIGDDVKTGDPMEAFSLSANLVINREDTASLEGVLDQGVQENGQTYRVFHEISAEIGKS